MKDISNLKAGRHYRVIKEFKDFDGRLHETGETWIFEKTNYVPYHSGLSLFVIENGQSVMYRFQDTDDEQGELLNDFMNYVEPFES